MADEVELKLELGEAENIRVSDLQKEFLQEELEEMPPVKEGDVNIHPVYFVPDEGGLEVKVFFRNGLKNKINFDKLPILVLDNNDKIVAHKQFELKDVGDIPPLSARPWKLHFDKEDMNESVTDYKNLKVCFDTNLKAFNSVKVGVKDLPDNLNLGDKRKLDKILNDLPVLQEGTFSLSAVEVTVNTEGNVIILVVMRNGADKDAKLEKIPMKLSDAEGAIVASGEFTLDNCIVEAKSAKLINFMFLKQDLLMEEFDLSKWKISFQS